jgi:uncharacterized protein
MISYTLQIHRLFLILFMTTIIFSGCTQKNRKTNKNNHKFSINTNNSSKNKNKTDHLSPFEKKALLCKKGSFKNCIEAGKTLLNQANGKKKSKIYYKMASELSSKNCKNNCWKHALVSGIHLKGNVGLKQLLLLSKKGCLQKEKKSCVINRFFSKINLTKIEDLAHMEIAKPSSKLSILKNKTALPHLKYLEKCKTGDGKNCYDLANKIVLHLAGFSSLFESDPIFIQYKKEINTYCNTLFGKHGCDLNIYQITNSNSLSLPIKLYTDSCRYNYSNGCSKALFFNILTKKKSDYQKILEKKISIENIECKKGNFEACISLGRNFIMGNSTKANLNKSKFYYKLALRLLKKRRKSNSTHHSIATHHDTLLSMGVKESTLRKILKSGCEKDIIKSCAVYGAVMRKIALKQRTGTNKRLKRKAHRKLNIAAWAFKKACSPKEPQGCLDLSSLYLNGLGVKKDMEQATQLRCKWNSFLKSACLKGDGKSCFDLGSTQKEKGDNSSISWYKKGCLAGYAKACILVSINTKSPKQSLFYRDRAIKIAKGRCLAGNPESCLVKGAAVLKFKGVPNGAAEAFPWFEKGCFGNISEGCWFAGYTKELTANSPSSMLNSYQLYKNSCQLKKRMKCSHLRKVKTVGFSLKKALASCNTNNKTQCLIYGNILSNEKVLNGRKRDFKELWSNYFSFIHRPKIHTQKSVAVLKTALLYFNKTCKMNQGEACLHAYNMSSRLNLKSSLKILSKKTVELLSKECNLRDPNACTTLGKIFSEGKLVPSSLSKARMWNEKAIVLYKKSCLKGDGKSCYGAAVLYDEKPPETKDFGKVLLFMEKACTKKVAPACKFLGGYWFSKSGSDKGGKFLSKACKLKDYNSCYSAGRFYERRGSRKARKYYLKACKQRLTKACIALRNLNQRN